MQMLLTALLLLCALDVEYPKKIDEHVNDFAKVLSPDQVAVIKKVAGDVRTSRKIPIVVCTVQSLEDYGAQDWTIQRYAAALYSDWGIGDKDQNLGVLLFVSIEDRKLRIALGDGLSASFSEPIRDVIEHVIVPRFKQGDFGGGIEAGADAIIKQVSLPPEEAQKNIAAAEQAQQQRQHSGGNPLPFIFWLMVIGFVTLSHFRRGVGRRYRHRHGGISPWVVLWGLNALSNSGRGGGSSWGGGGGGWGGGGGFSGGGGSFGGGGASGSW